MQSKRFVEYKEDSSFAFIFSIIFHVVLFLFLTFFFNKEDTTISQITVDLSQDIEIFKPSAEKSSANNSSTEQSPQEKINPIKESQTNPKETSKKSSSSLREQLQKKFGGGKKKVSDNASRRGVTGGSKSITDIGDKKVKSQNFANNNNSRSDDFIRKIDKKGGNRAPTKRAVPTNPTDRINNSYGRNNSTSKSNPKSSSKKGTKKGKISRNNNVQFKFKNNKRRYLVGEKKIFIPKRIKQSGIATKVVYSFTIKSNGFVYNIKLLKSSGVDDLDLIVRRYIQNLKFNRLQNDVSSYTTTLTYNFSVKEN